MCFLSVFLGWSRRRWLAAAGGAAAAFLLLGLPTAVVPNPLFGRSIPPTDWAMQVLVITAVLSGLLFATYVRNEPGPSSVAQADRTAKGGALGGILAFLAVGCPVCNKLVLVALGTTGAVQFFAPVQPYLAVAGMGVLGWALWVRLRGEAICALPGPLASADSDPGLQDVEPAQRDADSAQRADPVQSFARTHRE